jgi:hypothetical protein
MHAGEALWDLYALLTHLRSAVVPEAVADAALKACGIIGDLIKVPPPTQAVMQWRVDELFKRTGLLPIVPAVRAAAPSRHKATVPPKDADAQEALDLCDSILENSTQVPDKARDWADKGAEITRSIQSQVREKGTVTEKQLDLLRDKDEKVKRWLPKDDDMSDGDEDSCNDGRPW